MQAAIDATCSEDLLKTPGLPGRVIKAGWDRAEWLGLPASGLWLTVAYKGFY